VLRRLDGRGCDHSAAQSGPLHHSSTYRPPRPRRSPRESVRQTSPVGGVELSQEHPIVPLADRSRDGEAQREALVVSCPNGALVGVVGLERWRDLHGRSVRLPIAGSNNRVYGGITVSRAGTPQGAEVRSAGLPIMIAL
jgi:hypothetical protein